MFDALVNAFRAPDIRKRILFVLAMLVVVRGLAHVPVPGVNKAALDAVITANPFLQLLDLFSGGGLASFSIIALGVNPYINASIIMQLMTGVVPKLQQLQERVGGDDRVQRVLVDAWYRHMGKPTHHDQHQQDEKDPAPDIRRAKGVDEGVEHRASVLGSRVRGCSVQCRRVARGRSRSIVRGVG